MIQFREGKEMRKLGKGVNVKKGEKVLSKLVGRKLREVREHCPDTCTDHFARQENHYVPVPYM